MRDKIEQKKWFELENELSEWFKELSIINNLEFRNSYQSIPGFPTQGPRSDGLLILDNILIALEVEAGQTHPDTNTGKYWLLQDRYKEYGKIILFHIYTPLFDSYGWRKQLGEFYFEKMRETVPIEYILMDYRTSSNYESDLVTIKQRIKKELKYLAINLS